MPTETAVTTRYDTNEKVKELAGILSDVLDLMQQLQTDEVVSGEWIASRDMRIVEARIALEPVENVTSTETESERGSTTATTTPGM